MGRNDDKGAKVKGRVVTFPLHSFRSSKQVMCHIKQVSEPSVREEMRAKAKDKDR